MKNPLESVGGTIILGVVLSVILIFVARAIIG